MFAVTQSEVWATMYLAFCVMERLMGSDLCDAEAKTYGARSVVLLKPPAYKFFRQI
jgi:hypothetical protein